MDIVLLALYPRLTTLAMTAGSHGSHSVSMERLLHFQVCGRGKSMLVFTSDALDQNLATIASLNWPWPRALMLLSGAGLSRHAVRKVTDEVVVVEYLQEPEGVARVLGDIYGWMRHEVDRADWPLLYIDRKFSNTDLDAIREKADQNPFDVHAEFRRDGRLEVLWLGEMVASSTLMRDFLRMISNTVIDDGIFVELLRETFVWGPS